MRREVEQRQQQQRLRSLRSSMSLWTAVLLLVLVFFAIQGLRNSGFELTTPRIIIGIAVALLIFRQIARRMKRVVPRAAQPDPKSTLKLS